MSDFTTTAQALQNFQAKQPYFIGIDSDGCVFDSMEIKHKECFCPEFILHFGLQRVASLARECWEFVNLYSKSRGANRFLAVLEALDLLRERPETKERGANVPELPGLREWVKREKTLGNATLKTELARTGNEDLQRVWEWSNDVNRAVERLVMDVPPFPAARVFLEKAHKQADLMVVSQTPSEALDREWEEHGIHSYVRLIAGQELGTKTDHFRIAAAGKYGENRMLMIGDAFGDLKAGKASNALFYPIIPGQENQSWQRLHDEALPKFLEGTYAGDYEAGLMKEFEARLPSTPPWK